VGRASGITEAQLRDLAAYHESQEFSPLEKLVLDYAVELTRTPVDVSEALFRDLRKSFSERQLVEITAALAWENYRARFNHAFAIEAQGFCKGAYCPVPEGPGETEARAGTHQASQLSDAV